MKVFHRTVHVLARETGDDDSSFPILPATLAKKEYPL
jgi:hypothetical protein